MPLEGLRWSRDSGFALYDTPQTAVLGRAGGAEVIFADVNSYMKNFSYYHIDHIHFENKAKIEIARFMKNYI